MRWRQYRIARERMVRDHIYSRGIRDPRVLEAMLRVPRHLFIDRDAGTEAYANHSYPIGYQQTMSQPYMVAYLTENLRLEGEESVLEVGTGSGYHCAILASLCREVYSIERVADLAERATLALRDLLFQNAHIRVGDGAKGWPDAAPFDRVLLTAAASTVPKTLLSQLREGGFLLGPVVRADGSQEIVRLTREGARYSVERLIECAFVPLVREPGAAGGRKRQLAGAEEEARG